MSPGPVAVIGATSPVGRHVVQRLVASGRSVHAWTRGAPPADAGGVQWRRLPVSGLAGVPEWIVVAPVWALPEHLDAMSRAGARRVVAVSSTSVLVKADSADPVEQAVARQLAEGEAFLASRAAALGIEWVVLRPTLIYGGGRDRNIASVAGFIRRFGFFPLVGPASGRRQPIHADDVAAACIAALCACAPGGRTYAVSGADVLSYREMVAAVFGAMGRRPRFLPVPVWLVRIAVVVLRLLPAFRHVTPAMADRMGRDLVFDHAPAVKDFGFAPRRFRLRPEDVA